jgi:hypothetical protein
MFADSRKQFELAGLSEEETYNYFKRIADEGAAALSTMVDPAEINNSIAEINQAYMGAWGTLGAEQQALLKDEYLAYLDDLEALRDERLGAARETIDDQSARIAQETNEAIMSASERFVEAANRIAEAAALIEAASTTPVPVTVSFTGFDGFNGFRNGEIDYA